MVLLSGASKKNPADAAGTAALLFGRHARAKLSAAAAASSWPGSAQTPPACTKAQSEGSPTSPSRGFDHAFLSNGSRSETGGLGECKHLCPSVDLVRFIGDGPRRCASRAFTLSQVDGLSCAYLACSPHICSRGAFAGPAESPFITAASI